MAKGTNNNSKIQTNDIIGQGSGFNIKVLPVQQEFTKTQKYKASLEKFFDFENVARVKLVKGGIIKEFVNVDMLALQVEIKAWCMAFEDVFAADFVQETGSSFFTLNIYSNNEFEIGGKYWYDERRGKKLKTLYDTVSELSTPTGKYFIENDLPFLPFKVTQKVGSGYHDFHRIGRDVYLESDELNSILSQMITSVNINLHYLVTYMDPSLRLGGKSYLTGSEAANASFVSIVEFTAANR